MSKRKTHEEFVQELGIAHPTYKMIGKYQNAKTKVDILCDKGHLWQPTPTDALRCSCGECNKLFKYNQKTTDDLIRELKEKEIKAFPLEEYKGAREKILFQCLECEDHKFQSSPDNLLNKTQRCPICASKDGGEKHRRTLLTKNNMFANVHPEYVDCLVDKNNAYEYSYGSNKIVSWLCPDCNKIFEKPFCEIDRNGFSCPFCSKWKSYPNNFMSSILQQLKIDFIPEYSPDWIKPRKFDFYFMLNNQEYIIEMDGAFHYIERQKSQMTLDEVLSIDKYKQDLAIEHGIKVIRIDCNYYGIYQRKDYITENIKKSEINSILDLSTVNYDEADIFALQPSYKRVCEMWDSGVHDLNEIANQFKVDYTTVLRCLKYGEELGICNYSFSIEQEKRKEQVRQLGFSMGQPVMCNETGDVYSSISIASKAVHGSIHTYFKQNRNYAGMLSDGTKLTWTKISKEQYNKIINSRAS